MPSALRRSLRLSWLIQGWALHSLLLHSLLAVSQAQVLTTLTPDGTLGTTVTQTQTTYTIGGGTMRGSNLFHSFDRFSVGTGDTARFTGPPTGIDTILSRVTGGQQSVIDGLLQSTIPGANLYVLNPSGVLFGPHASLDVPASFHVSTADGLRFADGATFSAHLGEQSVLTVAPPVAFGFLHAHPAAIAIQASSLHVPEGKTLSVVGGDIEVVGSTFLTSLGIPTLGAPGGRVHVASVAVAGEVQLNPADQSFTHPADMARGRVSLAQGALVDVSSTAGSGTVSIQAGRLLIDQAFIRATTGQGDGALIAVDLSVAEDIVVAHEGTIEAHTTGAGRGGAIVVQTARLKLTDGAFIDSSTQGTGPGGQVTVTATDMIAITGRGTFNSGMYSETYSGDERAGSLVISAPVLDMAQAGRIETLTTGSGRAGDIVVQADHITLKSGAQIASNTVAEGPAGDVTVSAAETVTIAGLSDDGSRSGMFSRTTLNARGNAGDLVVTTPSLAMMDGGRISAVSNGMGSAGNIRVQGGRFTITDGAAIDSSTFGTGQGGSVTITATEAISIAGRDTQGLRSGVFSETTSSQDAGPMSVCTPSLAMTAGASIEALTGAAGRGGDIVVHVGQLTLRDESRIDSSTVLGSTGPGGSVTVMATDTLTILGPGSGLFSITDGRGQGRSIGLQANHLELSAGAAISAASTRTGNAGSMRITAQQMLLSEHSAVTTAAAQANGGDIQVTAQTMIRLRNSRLSTAVGSGEGAGGNITIDPEFVLLERSQISANASGGPGGNITITAGVFLADPASSVTASSARSVDGEIDIRAPVTNLSGIVTSLPQHFVQTATLLHNRCVAQLREGRISSLVVTGRDGVPTDPEGGLPSSIAEAGLGTTGTARHTGPFPGQSGAPHGVVRMDAPGIQRLGGWQVQSLSQHTLEPDCFGWQHHAPFGHRRR